ncbi:MAG: hypothetical protein YYHSYBAR_002742 [Candidatus Fervidibacter sacchari]
MTSPNKVGAKFLRHQLRVETRSMNGFGCVTKYEMKPVAWTEFRLSHQPAELRPSWAMRVQVCDSKTRKGGELG